MKTIRDLWLELVDVVMNKKIDLDEPIESLGITEMIVITEEDLHL